MLPIDYSKWDNIETSLEDDAPMTSSSLHQPAPQLSQPRATTVPTPNSRTQATPASTTTSPPSTVQAVLVRCEKERGPGKPSRSCPLTLSTPIATSSFLSPLSSASLSYSPNYSHSPRAKQTSTTKSSPTSPSFCSLSPQSIYCLVSNYYWGFLLGFLRLASVYLIPTAHA